MPNANHPDEALIESYLAAHHQALPPVTPLNKDTARRAEIEAHAAATIAIVKAIAGPSPAATSPAA